MGIGVTRGLIVDVDTGNNSEDAGAGLQECRGSTIDTRIWITSGKQLYYDCTAEPRCGR